MDIIKPNSSYPSIHDGLHVLTGSYASKTALGEDRISSVRIVTPLRTITYAMIYAVPTNTRTASIPPFSSQYRMLGYYEELNSQNYCLNLNVKVPSGYILKYLIIGSDDKLNLPINELETSTASSLGDTISLKFIIPPTNTATNTLTLVNNSDKTFTFSNPAAGRFRIVANSPLFSSTKTFCSAMLENNASDLIVSSATGIYVSSTIYDIYVKQAEETGLDTGIVHVSQTNPENRIHVSFEIFS